MPALVAASEAHFSMNMAGGGVAGKSAFVSVRRW
jgi:hypothetical protein